MIGRLAGIVHVKLEYQKIRHFLAQCFFHLGEIAEFLFLVINIFRMFAGFHDTDAEHGQDEKENEQYKNHINKRWQLRCRRFAVRWVFLSMNHLFYPISILRLGYCSADFTIEILPCILQTTNITFNAVVHK